MKWRCSPGLTRQPFHEQYTVRFWTHIDGVIVIPVGRVPCALLPVVVAEQLAFPLSTIGARWGLGDLVAQWDPWNTPWEYTHTQRQQHWNKQFEQHFHTFFLICTENKTLIENIAINFIQNHIPPFLYGRGTIHKACNNNRNIFSSSNFVQIMLLERKAGHELIL